MQFLADESCDFAKDFGWHAYVAGECGVGVVKEAWVGDDGG
jgi:hypothetical protein